MSSSSRIWPDRLGARAAALLLALVAAQGAGPAATVAAPSPAPGAPTDPAAVVPLPITAVHTGGGQTSLIVDLGASTRPVRRTVAVTYAGAPQPARISPVMGDDLTVALVVDASTAGAATLPAWLSAGARFVLEAPPTTRAVVIADTAPASAITGPQRGPTEILRALDTVRAGGHRDTAAALTLAAGQFPAAPPGRRLVVLYTTAGDAGGVGAAALVARFRAGGTILVVVGTEDTGRYWTDVSTATGGFFAPVGNPVVRPALDQVQSTLRGRHVVRFPTPPTLPTRVSVRVGTGDLTLTGDVTVTAPPAVASPRGQTGARTSVPWVPVAAAVLVLTAAVAVVLLLLRRRSRLRRSGLRRSGLRSSGLRRDTGPGGRGAGQPSPQDRPADDGRTSAADEARPDAADEVPPDAPDQPGVRDQPQSVARGRVVVSAPRVARGRATVPRPSRPPDPGGSRRGTVGPE